MTFATFSYLQLPKVLQHDNSILYTLLGYIVEPPHTLRGSHFRFPNISSDDG